MDRTNNTITKKPANEQTKPSQSCKMNTYCSCLWN